MEEFVEALCSSTYSTYNKTTQYKAIKQQQNTKTDLPSLLTALLAKRASKTLQKRPQCNMGAQMRFR